MIEISGFSKLSKNKKLEFITKQGHREKKFHELFKSFWHPNKDLQERFDEFSENTISNFYFPYGVIPNVLINGKLYCVPMVIEESSVVAAACNAANFWLPRGGIQVEVLGTEKIGQIHFLWKGESHKIKEFFESVRASLFEKVRPYLDSMIKRKGGMVDLFLKDLTEEEENLYQIFATFETCDAMGANLINSVLEALGKEFATLVNENPTFSPEEKKINIIMAILSNFNPNCRVKATVKCPIKKLADQKLRMDPEIFSENFKMAVRISKVDPFRAVTHNKGIFNGIDGVVLATGNDFRAIEAQGHAYAARSGKYQGLSEVSLVGGEFVFSLELPLSLGTVGALTSLHPLAKASLDLLGNPSAKELMMVVASIGLLQNFSALRSLVTVGIQKGHMKMHLLNILNQIQVSDEERDLAKDYFSKRIISYSAVKDFIFSRRGNEK